MSSYGKKGEGPPGSSEHGETLRKRNLESVYDRFTKGFDIAYLKPAKAPPDTLMQPGIGVAVVSSVMLANL